MSLINFHRLLISAGILFCGGYGIWELVQYRQTMEAGAETGRLLLGLTFLILAVFLAVYLARLRKFLGYDQKDDGSEEIL